MYSSDAAPMPKSSMQTLMPALRRLAIRRFAASMSSTAALSVISMIRRFLSITSSAVLRRIRSAVASVARESPEIFAAIRVNPKPGWRIWLTTLASTA